MEKPIGKRIIVVGTTGSGKSTLAKNLAELLDAPHIELDSLFWKADWGETPNDQFFDNIRGALNAAGDTWIVDGNYSRSRTVTWSLADTLIWLDYPLHVIYWRLFKRTLRRTLLREELWHGNRERFWTQFFSRESLFLWALQTYRRRRRTYSAMIRDNSFPHLHIIRLRGPRETDRWLMKVKRLLAH